jgi:hypothetical protein
VVLAAGLAGFVACAMRLPSPLAMSLIAALAMAQVALALTTPASRTLRLGLMFAAGLLLYGMPIAIFVASVTALAMVAAVAAFVASGLVREADWQVSAALVVLLSARAALFNLSVVDPRLTLLLGDNHLNMAAFFL